MCVVCCVAGYSNQLNEPVCESYQPRRVSTLVSRAAIHWDILHGLVFCVSFDWQLVNILYLVVLFHACRQMMYHRVTATATACISVLTSIQ